MLLQEKPWHINNTTDDDCDKMLNLVKLLEGYNDKKEDNNGAALEEEGEKQPRPKPKPPLKPSIIGSLILIIC